MLKYILAFIFDSRKKQCSGWILIFCEFLLWCWNQSIDPPWFHLQALMTDHHEDACNVFACNVCVCTMQIHQQSRAPEDHTQNRDTNKHGYDPEPSHPGLVDIIQEQQQHRAGTKHQGDFHKQQTSAPHRWRRGPVFALPECWEKIVKGFSHPPDLEQQDQGHDKNTQRKSGTCEIRRCMLLHG